LSATRLVEVTAPTRRATESPRRSRAVSGGESLGGAAEPTTCGDQLAAEAANRQALGLGEVVDLSLFLAEKLAYLACAVEQVISKSVSL
jgi:hypothetical protein